MAKHTGRTLFVFHKIFSEKRKQARNTGSLFDKFHNFFHFFWQESPRLPRRHNTTLLLHRQALCIPVCKPERNPTWQNSCWKPAVFHILHRLFHRPPVDSFRSNLYILVNIIIFLFPRQKSFFLWTENNAHGTLKTAKNSTWQKVQNLSRNFFRILW